LTGPTSATFSVSNAQILLQEACLSSIESRVMTFKLSSLRDQKKMLLSPRLNPQIAFTRGKPKDKVFSVRPIVAVLLALRKMARMSWHLKVTFVTRD
jgi:hypothetical protein